MINIPVIADLVGGPKDGLKLPTREEVIEVMVYRPSPDRKRIQAAFARYVAGSEISLGADGEIHMRFEYVGLVDPSWKGL